MFTPPDPGRSLDRLIDRLRLELEELEELAALDAALVPHAEELRRYIDRLDAHRRPACPS